MEEVCTQPNKSKLMGRKGVKSQKGKGESWNEPKNQVLNARVTATAKNWYVHTAQAIGQTVPELLERIARGLVDLPTKAQNLPFEQIKREIPRLSVLQLTQLIELIAQALAVKLQRSRGATIATLVRMNREAVIEAFEDVIDLGRVDALIQGDRPTPDELAFLSTALNQSFEELQQICKEEFGNGDPDPTSSARVR